MHVSTLPEKRIQGWCDRSLDEGAKCGLYLAARTAKSVSKCYMTNECKRYWARCEQEAVVRVSHFPALRELCGHQVVSSELVGDLKEDQEVRFIQQSYQINQLSE